MAQEWHLNATEIKSWNFGGTGMVQKWLRNGILVPSKLSAAAAKQPKTVDIEG